MLKAIIVEDEKLAREMLAHMLREAKSESVEVLACCEDIPGAVKAIRKYQPDVVFLDIELPGFSGLELLNFFNEDEINFHIIFTTAYNQYAIQAFKLAAVDYLLKPVTSEDLYQALQLLDRRVQSENYFELKNRFNNPQLKNRLVVNTNQSIRFLHLDQIIYLEACGAYTIIRQSDGEEIVTSKNIKHYEDILASFPQFQRCHRSYIINMDFVSAFVRNDGGFLRLKEYEIPVSQDKIEFLKKFWNEKGK